MWVKLKGELNKSCGSYAFLHEKAQTRNVCIDVVAFYFRTLTNLALPFYCGLENTVKQHSVFYNIIL
jgi:hypothetical protein